MLDSSIDRLFDRRENQSLIGKNIGSFEVVRQLSPGLYCNVYEAFDCELKRPVAIKILNRGPWLTANVLRRFHQEGQILAKLRHPNIVFLYALRQWEDSPCLVMEYVDGGTLADFMKNRPPLSASEAGLILLRIARAVAAAHEVSIIHRDLKPQNILLDRLTSVTDLETIAGNIKVGDFGIAKLIEGFESLTRTGQQPGTANYMAPEQISDELGDIGFAADVHAIGVIAYWLTTGELPFNADRPIELFREIVQTVPPPPSDLAAIIPLWFDNFCRRCLAKKPIDRFEDAGQAAEYLHRQLTAAANGRAFQRDQGMRAGLPTVSKLSPLRDRSRLLVKWLFGAILFLVIVLALRISTWLKN